MHFYDFLLTVLVENLNMKRYINGERRTLTSVKVLFLN